MGETFHLVESPMVLLSLNSPYTGKAFNNDKDMLNVNYQRHFLRYYLGKNKIPGPFLIFKLWYTWFDIKIGDQNEANKQGYQMAQSWDS